jgi:hypothetical protein
MAASVLALDTPHHPVENVRKAKVAAEIHQIRRLR